jgi:hypothetical protein
VSWRELALCAHVDPRVFFPKKGGSAHEAKRICGICPVREECLEITMSIEENLCASERYGVFGGLSPKERAALARSREETAA